MRNPVTSLLYLLILLSSILTLVGCSRDNQDSWEQIKRSGRIRLAMSGDFPPFNYRNRNGDLEGFDVDMAMEIGRRLRVEVDLKVTKWAGIIHELNEGKFDAILGSMAITPDRQKLVLFTIPYYHSSAQVMVHMDSKLSSLQDLRKKTIGVGEDSSYLSDARNLGAGSIRKYRSAGDAFRDLKKGNLDALVTDRITGTYILKGGQYPVRFLGRPLRDEQVAIALRMKDKIVLKKLNTVLNDMHKDGTIGKLIRKVAQCEYDCTFAF